MLGDPSPDLGVLVRGVVITDDVDVEVRGRLPVDQPQKLGADRSCVFQALYLCQQVERLVLVRAQGRRRCVYPHGGANAGTLPVEQASGHRVAAVGQQEIARFAPILPPQRL